eukprot:jgi/Bigna1/127139/aug1.4_g1847
MDSSLDELGRNNFIDYMWGLGTDFHDGEANSIMVDIKHYNTLTSVSALSLDRQINPYEELLPASPAYFAYQGSLTSPPCTEGVEWVVMAEPIGISTSQVDYFTFAMSNVTNATNYPQYSHHKSKYINSRPIKPLGTRTVSFYAGIGHSSHSSHDDHHEDPWYTPMIMPLGDAFAFFGHAIHQMRKDEHEHIEAKQEHKALLKMLTASEANLPKIDENDNNDEDDKRPNPELGRKSEAGSLVLIPRSSSGTAAAASGKEVELKQLKVIVKEMNFC